MNNQSIEIGTLLGKPHIFLRGIECSEEIINEFAEQGQKIEGVVCTPEIAIPLDQALSHCLLIEDGKARFLD